MIDRWTVVECDAHGIRSIGSERCQCRPAGASFEVVRAIAARTADPDTSKRAALRQAPRSGSQRGRILDALREHGPMSSREIEEQTGIAGAWKRVSELKQGGHICELRIERDDQTGTDVTVYALADRTQTTFAGALF